MNWNQITEGWGSPPRGLWEVLGDFEQLDIVFQTFQLNND